METAECQLPTLAGNPLSGSLDSPSFVGGGRYYERKLPVTRRGKEGEPVDDQEEIQAELLAWDAAHDDYEPGPDPDGDGDGDDMRAWVAAMPLAPPRQANPRLETRTASPRHHDLDHAQRPHLHPQGRALPRLNVSQDGRPPNCQLCTSMSAYRLDVRTARAVAGSAALSSTAVPSQVAPSSDSNGP